MAVEEINIDEIVSQVLAQIDVDGIADEIIETIKQQSVRIEDLPKTNNVSGTDLIELDKGRSVSLEDLKTYIRGIGIFLEIIGKNDDTIPTDNNVFSALRTLAEISKSNEKLKDIFLRKDQPDSTRFLLKLLAGAFFGDFVTGMRGGYIGPDGKAELESLHLRSGLIVPYIRYNFMTYFAGYNLISPGGGLKIKEIADNGDGSWTITPDLDEGIPCGQFKDDILLGYWYDKTATGDFAGFKKVQFLVGEVDYNAKTFVMTARPGTDAVPVAGMKLGQTGNFTNTDRQTYIILDTRDGNNNITFFDNANTWDPEPAQEKSWFGKKKGRTIEGINCDNYSAVLQNIIMSGLIFQTDEITGENIRIPIWKGEWKPGKYAYFNEVSHNGSRYLCINTAGTEEEPGTGADWLVTIEKGEDGEDGKSPTLVQVTSSKGVFFQGGIVETILTATVYQDDVDITDTIPSGRFTWTRTSSNVEEDKLWNATHQGVGKQITIDMDDVTRSAVFECLVTI